MAFNSHLSASLALNLLKNTNQQTAPATLPMNHRGLRPAFNRTLYLAFGTPFGQFATMITLGLACASIFVVNPPQPDEDEDDDEEEEDPSLEEVVKSVSFHGSGSARANVCARVFPADPSWPGLGLLCCSLHSFCPPSCFRSFLRFSIS